jgi:hypothetical protein
VKIPLQILTILILLSNSIFTQDFTIKGTVRDSADNVPCIGANIKLSKIFSEQNPSFTTTNKSGDFEFVKIEPGRYLLEISFIGYNKFIDTVRAGRRDVNLGNILMVKVPLQLEQVDVIGNIIQAEQKEDTIQFLAKGFKTNVDANAEELITKIPGVIREDGKIKTQGEDVKQILVDGKQFFGDDPDIALKNLPAELIEKIQIYDKMSDQAQFTGFDDGQSSKTINIITRQDRQRGQFGKLYAGYGTDDRYMSGGNLNLFRQERRIALIGLVNNVNQQNFSPQDLLGITGSRNDRQFRPPGMRGGGYQGRGGGESENFLVGGQEGNTDTYSFGLSYVDSWGKDLNLSGSYFFNFTNNANDQLVNREYYANSQSAQFYSENSNSSAKNFNHRINLRLEYNIDTLNSIFITPKLYFQDNSSLSKLFGSNFLNTNLSSTIDNSNDANNKGYNLSNELLLRHKFDLPGRTISLSLNMSLNHKNTDKNVFSFSKYFGTGPLNEDSIDQQTEQLTKGYNLSSNLVYTEPAGNDGQIQANFSANLNNNRSDKKTNSFNSVSQIYNDLDSLLSNEYQNDYSTLRGGLSYRFRTEDWNLSAGVSYQQSSLKGEQIFPLSNILKKDYSKFLPNTRIQYKLSESSNLRFNYNANINPPSISQLQNTPDNTNTLFLRSGNPELNEEYSHRLSVRFMNTSFQTGASLFAMIFLSYTGDYIGNTTLTAVRDTLLPNGIFLRKGSQLTYPINFDYSYSLRSFINAGLPIDLIKCNLNLNSSINFSLTPGQVNGINNFSKSYSISQGLMINSNISEEIDFRLSYIPTYNITKNDIQTELNRDYFVHNASAGLYWLFRERFYIRSDFSYYFNQGISKELKREYYLWSGAFGIKLFSDKSGELKFETFDVLDQNKSLNRSITETYIEDKSTIVLRRYFMLSFIYNLRMFGG